MKTNFGFYGILTTPKMGYEALAEIMVRHRVKYIQLRMKETPDEVVVDMARRLRAIIGGDSLFIVNDRPDIALEVGADGVHIGQDDTPYDQVRQMMGPDRIVGLSTHNPDQTSAACGLCPLPDYIGVGPVFATPTKKTPDPVIGLDGMQTMLKKATLPAVAIGGIDLDNLVDVLDHGAKNLCAVRCVNQADDPGTVIQHFQTQLSARG